VKDPDAPYGRRPDGTPYKRDPGPFTHLRGKPFGSVNGQAPARRGAAKATPKPRATLAAPKLDAAGYGGKIARGFRSLAKLASRRAPAPAAIIAVRSDQMAEAWGRVAVSYPKFGVFIDRLGKGGDLSDAIGGTVLTLAMIAHVQGLTQGTPLADLLDDAVGEVLHTFATSDEFGGLRDKMAKAAEARAASVADQGEATDAAA